MRDDDSRLRRVVGVQRRTLVEGTEPMLWLTIAPGGSAASGVRGEDRVRSTDRQR
jgi:hypothetical protein